MHQADNLLDRFQACETGSWAPGVWDTAYHCKLVISTTMDGCLFLVMHWVARLKFQLVDIRRGDRITARQPPRFQHAAACGANKFYRAGFSFGALLA